MMSTDLRQTSFQIEKLKNIVKVHRGAAYQILTSPGKQLGRIGAVVDPALQVPANDPTFPPEAARNPAVQKSAAWFRKILAAFKA